MFQRKGDGSYHLSAFTSVQDTSTLEGVVCTVVTALIFGTRLPRIKFCIVYLEKTLMLGRTEGKRRRGQQRMRRLDSITD